MILCVIKMRNILFIDGKTTFHLFIFLEILQLNIIIHCTFNEKKINFVKFPGKKTNNYNS